RLVSDWSSDVCSSDLAEAAVDALRVLVVRIHLSRRLAIRSLGERARRCWNQIWPHRLQLREEIGLIDDQVTHDREVRQWFDANQIGRASCRERGESSV